MARQATGSPVQLLVYRFGPDAAFDGWLVGALERLEAGGSVRVLDALFVRTDGETGEPAVLDASGEGIGSMLVSLIDFRLDPDERRHMTERALGADATGVALDEVVSALEPGGAVAAVLVEHVWARTLDDAVARSGGTTLVSKFVDATALADVSADVRAAVSAR
jgi:hypothetical protein